MQKIVLVSSIVDQTIGTTVKGYDIEIYSGISELRRHIELTPIRCYKFVVTCDTVLSDTSSSFRVLSEIANNEYFRCEEIIYVTLEEATELTLLNFLIEEKRMPEVTIIKGELTREFIANVIRGTHDQQAPPRRVEIVRRRRSDYIEEQIKAKRADQQGDDLGIDDLGLFTEEDMLNSVPDQGPPKTFPIGPNDRSATLIQIAGGPGRGKTVFSIILAQFIADSKKVCLIESDLKYFSLSHYIKMSGIEYMDISIDDFYANPDLAILKINNSHHNLIVFTGTSALRKRRPSTSYLKRLVYNLINKDVDYLIVESSLREILPATETIVVLKNEIPAILEDLEKMPNKVSDIKFVCLSLSTLNEVQVMNTEEVRGIVQEVLNVDLPPIPLYKITALQKGADVIDLRRYM